MHHVRLKPLAAAIAMAAAAPVFAAPIHTGGVAACAAAHHGAALRTDTRRVAPGSDR